MEEEAEVAAARPSKKARGTAASGLTAFGLRLAKHLANAADGADGVNGGGQNVVFSPLSIYAALALVTAGARGTTLDELLTVLGVASRNEIAEFVSFVVEHALADGSESGGPLVAFACALWHEKTLALKPVYKAAAVESYKAETHTADFFNKAEKARVKINRWVSKATKNLITSILPQGSVDSTTALVLANAIYFKGSWSMPFAKRDTETSHFRRLDGSHVRTPFMRSQKNHAVAEYDGFKVLKLAYHPYRLQSRGNRNATQQDGQGSAERPQFSMCVFLPDAHDGLPSLMDKMATCPSFLWDHMPSERVEVRKLLLPKFKLSFSSRINEVLKAMGIKAAFGKGTADLSDMLQLEGRPGLFLKHVFHKAVIEVNEEGTEAAASTACVIKRRSQCYRPPKDFVADHPFAFFLVEEVSGIVVFMGHVLDPTKSE